MSSTIRICASEEFKCGMRFFSPHVIQAKRVTSERHELRLEHLSVMPGRFLRNQTWVRDTERLRGESNIDIIAGWLRSCVSVIAHMEAEFYVLTDPFHSGILWCVRVMNKNRRGRPTETKLNRTGFLCFQILTWLGYSNSAFNPIIYSIFNSEFRSAFHRILTSKLPPCCSQFSCSSCPLVSCCRRCRYQAVALVQRRWVTFFSVARHFSSSTDFFWKVSIFVAKLYFEKFVFAWVKTRKNWDKSNAGFIHECTQP